MFRSKDRCNKWRRKAKKYNPNKPKNIRQKEPYDNFMAYGWLKGVQQTLREEHGIRVQKSEMHGIVGTPPPWFDTDKKTGNSTYSVIKTLVEKIETRNHFPQESHIVHDMTKWKKSKKQTKMRKAQRRYKHDMYN